MKAKAINVHEERSFVPSSSASRMVDPYREDDNDDDWTSNNGTDGFLMAEHRERSVFSWWGFPINPLTFCFLNTSTSTSSREAGPYAAASFHRQTPPAVAAENGKRAMHNDSTKVQRKTIPAYSKAVGRTQAAAPSGSKSNSTTRGGNAPSAAREQWESTHDSGDHDASDSDYASDGTASTDLSFTHNSGADMESEASQPNFKCIGAEGFQLKSAARAFSTPQQVEFPSDPVPKLNKPTTTQADPSAADDVETKPQPAQPTVCEDSPQLSTSPAAISQNLNRGAVEEGLFHHEVSQGLVTEAQEHKKNGLAVPSASKRWRRTSTPAKMSINAKASRSKTAGRNGRRRTVASSSAALELASVRCNTYHDQDFCGTTIDTSSPRHIAIHESRKMVDDSLKELESQLQKMSQDKAKTKEMSQRIKVYEEAALLNPRYVNSRAFRLMFLRFKLFDCAATANAILDFFAEKQRLFGSELAAQPTITFEDLDDDTQEVLNAEVGLGLHFFQFVRDQMGRSVLLDDLANTIKHASGSNPFENVAYQRALWYLFMASLTNNETTQRLGIVWVEVISSADDEEEGGHNGMPTILKLTRERKRLFASLSTMLQSIPFRVASRNMFMIQPQQKGPGSTDDSSSFMELIVKNNSSHCPFNKSTKTNMHVGLISECQFSLRAQGILCNDDTFPYSRNGSLDPAAIQHWVQRLKESEKSS